ncbi:MAG TPA: 50S ribosomal protein L37e [Candidatus Thermoplasmatota archaeon]|nr:50S ribosomal protein L37e [Candidatus Thermoplasmatota archaeon]
MGKGTPAKGKRQKPTHMPCRRCGRRSYHKQRRVCAACGFGQTAKLRHYKWSKQH